jgi:hypothetical protein
MVGESHEQEMPFQGQQLSAAMGDRVVDANEFASLPGEFATVGKLIWRRNRTPQWEFCPKKHWSLPVCQPF